MSDFNQIFIEEIPSEHAKRKRLKAKVRAWLIENCPTDDIKKVRQFLEEL